jgi:flagellar L-ring protein precursor FlgH
MKIYILILSLVFLSNCAGSNKEIRESSGLGGKDDLVAPDGASSSGTEEEANTSSVRTTPGSLWHDDNRNMFFQDTKARRVGDLVRVKIVENAKGTKKTSTDAEKKNGFSTKIASMFGKSPAFSPVADLESGSNFSGKGNTARSGELVAVLSAKVIGLQPNGNLKVEGFKEIMLNNERQLIKLKGIVRPEDIDAQNTVNSDVIADASIEFTGKGILNKAQKPGWLMQALGYIWPF